MRPLLGLGFATAACLAASVSSCNPLDVTRPPTASVIHLSTSALTFTALADTQAVSALVQTTGGPSSISGRFTWESEDTTVARVLVDSVLRQHARVVAIGAGRIDIVVRFDNATPARLRVDVTPVAASITFASREPVLLVGAGAQRSIVPVVRDARGNVINDVSLQWESSAPAVATVSGGVVTAVATGGVDIVARAGAVVSPAIPIEVLVGAPLAPARPATLVSIENTTCGIATDGLTYCWGRGQYGRLGTGVLDDATDPVPVAGGHAFVALNAGNVGPCGITAAASAFCWGGHLFFLYAAVPSPAGEGQRARRRYGGFYCVAGPNAPIGGQWCTRGSYDASLGTDGIARGWSSIGGAGMATQVPFAEVVSTDGSSCGVVTNGSVYCWPHRGNHGPGELTRPFGTAAFRAVAVGSDFTCALDAAGVVSCVGGNWQGQLGDGSTVDRTTPAPVAGGLRFTAILANGYSVCGLATDGAAYCWGRNALGELGDGSLEYRSVPTPVTGGHRFVAFAEGSPTCALTAEGAAYCWGGPDPLDSAGPVRTEPVRVAPALRFRLPD